MAEVLTPKETREILGFGRVSFRNHEKAGKFRQLMVSRPIGRRRYSAAKVKAFAAGQSLARVS